MGELINKYFPEIALHIARILSNAVEEAQQRSERAGRPFLYADSFNFQITFQHGPAYICPNNVVLEFNRPAGNGDWAANLEPLGVIVTAHTYDQFSRIHVPVPGGLLSTLDDAHNAFTLREMAHIEDVNVGEVEATLQELGKIDLAGRNKFRKELTTLTAAADTNWHRNFDPARTSRLDRLMALWKQQEATA